jgi:hypothetical protein
MPVVLSRTGAPTRTFSSWTNGGRADGHVDCRGDRCPSPGAPFVYKEDEPPRGKEMH